MAEKHIGDKVKLIVEAIIIDVSNSHGTCYLVEFPMEDFTAPRLVWLNESEIVKSEQLNPDTIIPL